MVLVLECIIICFILLVPCVVSIADGIEQAAFLFEAVVRDRVVEMGLVTRERPGFFTLSYETADSLRKRLAGMYETAEVQTVEAMACFRCRRGKE